MRPQFVTFGDSITQRGFAPSWTGQLADAYQRRADVANRGTRALDGGRGRAGEGLGIQPADWQQQNRAPAAHRRWPHNRSRPGLPLAQPPYPAPPFAGYSGYNSRWALHLMHKIFPLDAAAPLPPPRLVTVFFGANDAALPDRGS